MLLISSRNPSSWTCVSTNKKTVGLFSTPAWKYNLLMSETENKYDECCGKIDLFRVKNRLAHILPWWECCQVYHQTEGLFLKDARIILLTCILIPNIWLYMSTSNRTNFTQFWSPKICQFFKPRTGRFLCDTHHICEAKCLFWDKPL